VIFSIERVIAVYLPIKSTQIKNSNLYKISGLFITFFGLGVYSFNLIASELILVSETNKCGIKENWSVVIKFMALVKRILKIFKLSLYNYKLEISDQLIKKVVPCIIQILILYLTSKISLISSASNNFLKFLYLKIYILNTVNFHLIRHLKERALDPIMYKGMPFQVEILGI
jgi:hypothetical protein